MSRYAYPRATYHSKGSQLTPYVELVRLSLPMMAFGVGAPPIDEPEIIEDENPRTHPESRSQHPGSETAQFRDFDPVAASPKNKLKHGGGGQAKRNDIERTEQDGSQESVEEAEMTVTRAEGNLINTLNDANPTRLLLRAIQAAGIDSTSEAAILFKEGEEFYLGVCGDGDVSQTYTIYDDDDSDAGKEGEEGDDESNECEEQDEGDEEESESESSGREDDFSDEGTSESDDMRENGEGELDDYFD
ncbi:hypothetical protein V5O48_010617 [Marasmius crinis-equi]|uniref:Uncharacterized protein n=1 Tax=Marasmius crinis-equi TaxID=585013 RepID=A0ABR3F7W9_9AGAR